MQGDLSYFQGKNVLVTGAAGFIGSHLCDALLKNGARVTGVDNFLTGRPQNIAHLENEGHFSFIQADVIQSPLDYLPEDVQFDAVYHMASPASPPRYQAHPVETYLVNSLGTHQLLQHLLMTNPHGRFIFASTSEVYGDPLEHPQKESYWGNVNPNGPRACYDEAKRLGESICGVHQRDFELDVRIARIFNTYGPRMDIDDGRVIPSFAKSLLANVPLVIQGDGLQTRSYCYVDDLVNGFLRLGAGDTLSGITVNLGNPDEYTIQETAEVMLQVAQELGLTEQTELKTNQQPLPTDDPSRRKPDISVASNRLGWQPTIPFKEGLQETLKYFAAQ